jgi:hypothetical protein
LFSTIFLLVPQNLSGGLGDHWLVLFLWSPRIIDPESSRTPLRQSFFRFCFLVPQNYRSVELSGTTHTGGRLPRTAAGRSDEAVFSPGFVFSSPRIMMSTDCHFVQQENSPPDLATLERSRAAGGPPQAGSPWAEARVGQPWSGLGRSVRPGGTVAQPSDPLCTAPIIGRRCRWPPAQAPQVRHGLGARLDGSTRGIPLHRTPALHYPGQAHTHMLASLFRRCGGCQRLGFGRLRLLRDCSLLFAQSRCGCMPDAPADSTARLSTVTPPRAAPPGLSFPACASPS